MNRRMLPAAFLAGALSALGACTESTAPPEADPVLTDQRITEDVALVSGDAIANDVGELLANELFLGLPGVAPSFSLFGSPPGVAVSRSRTCYDQNDQPQTQCDPLTTSYIVLAMSLNGSFSASRQGPRGTDTLTVAVHRTRNLTISGLLGQETSRTHDGVGSSNDTTHLVGVHDDVTLDRTVRESSLDSIVGVVFNLPRASNPFPAAGRIVKRVSGSIEMTLNGVQHSRVIDRRVEVTFPPDNQGNVTMTITVGTTTRTCQLNLVTHRVTGCQ